MYLKPHLTVLFKKCLNTLSLILKQTDVSSRVTRKQINTTSPGLPQAVHCASYSTCHSTLLTYLYICFSLRLWSKLCWKFCLVWRFWFGEITERWQGPTSNWEFQYEFTVCRIATPFPPNNINPLCFCAPPPPFQLSKLVRYTSLTIQRLSFFA